MNNPAIRVEQVSKAFYKTKALDGVTFSVMKGSIHGFLGPNGAGKSTVMRIITGLIPPTAGDVWVNGISITGEQMRAKSQIGFMPEHLPLYDNMTVIDYLVFIRDLNTINSKKRFAIDPVLEKCDLTTVKKRLIGNLSRGYRQRVGIAGALSFNPEILILDEPMVGLDPSATEKIKALIVQLKGDHTVLLSSHQLHDVSTICSDITIINQGKVVKSGPLEEIQNSFKTGRQLIFHVQTWKSELVEELRDRFDIGDCNVTTTAGNTVVKVTLGSGNTDRAEISKFIVEKELGLLTINEEQLGLNDVFKLATQEEYNSTSEAYK